MHFSERDFPKEFFFLNHQNQISSQSTNNSNIHLFGNRQCYNTPNQYQPLFSPNDHCVKYSEGSVNYNLSYCMETILSIGR